MQPFVRSLADSDKPQLAEHLRAAWGSTRMATRGRLVEVAELPGFVAQHQAEWLGYVAYEERDGALEIVALEGVAPGSGTGSALLARCVEEAMARGLARVWLITTNDNVPALRFYQRRGFVLVALRPGAVDEARRTLKPEIAEVGLEGIPIRDEIELELPRSEWAAFVECHKWPS